MFPIRRVSTSFSSGIITSVLYSLFLACPAAQAQWTFNCGRLPDGADRIVSSIIPPTSETTTFYPDGHDSYAQIVTHGKDASKAEVWCIDGPNVLAPATDYPHITFRAGDKVTINAGGCVQTGGSGNTWKRYVDPQDRDADRLYHGYIWIPGATAGLVAIQGVVGQTLTVPLLLPSYLADKSLFLRLGYQEDNDGGFADNGYW